MPAVIAPLLVPVLAPALGAAATIVANIAAYAIIGGAAYLLQRMLAPDTPEDKQQPGQVHSRQALPPRRKAFGFCLLAGDLAFMEAKGGQLYQLWVHTENEIWGGMGSPTSREVRHFLNDKLAAVGSNSLIVGGNESQGRIYVNGEGPWGEWVHLETRMGTEDQTASAFLLAAFPDAWTADHRLKGLAYTAIRCQAPPPKQFQSIFPNGVPSVRVLAQTALVPDPSNVNWTDPDTWTYSANAGRCILRYLTEKRTDATTGISYQYLPESRIHVASWIAFCSLCDENVTTSAGEEDRYSLNGTYTLTEEPRDVLRRMLQTCDGELVPMPDGTVGIRGGKWDVPTVTLTQDHIRSMQVRGGQGKLRSFNRLSFSYTSPDHDWQQIEGDPWEDTADQDATGEILAEDLSLPMVISHSQARRLAKIYMAKNNPAWRLQIEADLAGLDALGERTITVSVPEVGINTTFLVESFEIMGDFTGCAMTLASLDASAYAWTLAEEGTPPAVPEEPDTSVTMPVPTGITSEVITTSGSPRVRIVVATPSDPSATTVGRYRRRGDTDWLNMLPDEAGTAYAAISDVLEPDRQYEFQVAHAGYGGIDSGSLSDWAPEIPLHAPLAYPSGLQMLFGFNYDSPDEYVDESGHGVTLTKTGSGGIIEDGDNGRVYQATVSGQYLTSNYTLAAGGSYTLMAWIDPTALTGTQGIIGGSVSSRFNLRLTGSTLEMVHGTTVVASYALPNADRRHIAATYSAANTRIRLYSNGTQVAESTSAAAIATGAVVRIASTFIGKIDDVAVFTSELTGAEVEMMMDL